MIGIAVFFGTLLLHASTAWRYGYFRDELYFIACSRHMAWGFVDQPPLVAVAALASSPFGYQLEALRLLPMLAAAFTSLVAVAIARDLGGGRFAQALAGIAVALTPAYLLLGNTLTTTSFEGLAWTLAMWCCIRIVRAYRDTESSSGPEGLWWYGLAASITFGLYGKYSMTLLVIALVVGFLCTAQRHALLSRWLLFSTALVLVLTLPNLTWQAAHGWPMIDVLRGDAEHRHAFNTGLQLEYHSFAKNALAFASEQALYTNPVAALLWLTGIIAPLGLRSLRDLRFISIAYLVLFVLAVVLEGKGYYIIGIYATLLAIGAIVLERALAWVRLAFFALLVIVAIATLPLSLPVLPIHDFVRYSQTLGLTGRGGTPAHVIQPVYAEEFGWNRLARDVARVYLSLPEDQRTATAIYADTYADAGAIDFFGPRYGLPRAISSQNSYYHWGTRDFSGSPMIAIGATRIDILKRYYRSCSLIATSDEPLKWAVEGPAPIYLCTGPTQRLDQFWPSLRWYGA